MRHTFTTNETSSVYTVRGGVNAIVITSQAAANLGTGSPQLAIERKPAGGSWYTMRSANGITMTDIILAVPFDLVLNVAQGDQIRATLSGATSPNFELSIEA